MWSRLSGRGAAGSKTLPADLKRVTHSGVIDIPKEVLTPVIEASRNEEDRPEIMQHLRQCLAEPAGKQWRRIFGALVLAEALVKSGSPALLSETAEGRHFDLVQRLSFLEHFDDADKRVTNMIRSKAEALRKEVVPLLQNTSLRDSEDIIKDTASTCSPGAVSTVTRSTAASSSTGFGSDDVFVPPQETSTRPVILNNIVAVGHNDDTTSGSEAEGQTSRAPAQQREPRRQTASARNERSRCGGSGGGYSSSGSEAELEEASAPTLPAAPVEDLLEMRAPAPASTMNLLDL